MRIFEPGRTAVITGAASGIGLASARACLKRGLRVMLSDVDADLLERAAYDLSQEAPDRVASTPCDVSDAAQVERLRDAAMDAFGPVHLLHLNAGIGRPTKPWDGRAEWEATLGVNLWGVVNGFFAFVPGMQETGEGAAVVVTGSKQGITNPPGNAAYNASKAAVKAVTEQLAWEFRVGKSGATAHLLIPGWTFTGLTAREGGDKPAGAWWPDQVAEMMVEGVERGDFYILCPDNEVTRDVDAKRIAWGAADIFENRPALSRWDSEFSGSFKG